MKKFKCLAIMMLTFVAALCLFLVSCGTKSSIVVDCDDEIVVEYGTTFSIPNAKIVDSNNKETGEKLIVTVTDANGDNVNLSYNSSYLKPKLQESILYLKER